LSPRVGVRTDESRQPTVEIARCSGERITSVELLDGSSSSDPVIWRVESDGTALDVVTVGETPPGFVETVPLVDVVRSDTHYRVVVRGDGTKSEVFRPVDLERNRVQSAGVLEDLDRFRARGGGSCQPFSGTALAILVIVVVLFFALWVFGLVFWIVKLVQVVRIPEHQYRAAGTDKTAWVLVVVLASFIGALIWHFGPRRRVLAAAGFAPPLPPGWYPMGGSWQWWDGRQWVTTTTPPSMPPQYPPPPPPPPPPPAP
jgi:hypothetical protein